MKHSKEDALEMATRFAPPGSTIYCVLRSVARSGLSRVIGLYVVHEGSLQYLSGYASILTGRTLTRDGVRIQGGGMDMGFALVDELSHAMGYHGKDSLKHDWL